MLNSLSKEQFIDTYINLWADSLEVCVEELAELLLEMYQAEPEGLEAMLRFTLLGSAIIASVMNLQLPSYLNDDLYHDIIIQLQNIIAIQKL